MRFRKKPDVVDAFRLGQKGKPTPAPEWFESPDSSRITDEGILIPTFFGYRLAKWGDWVIRDRDGDIYPCEHERFVETFEREDY
jgi:hypothetical protein